MAGRAFKFTGVPGAHESFSSLCSCVGRYLCVPGPAQPSRVFVFIMMSLRFLLSVYSFMCSALWFKDLVERPTLLT